MTILEACGKIPSRSRRWLRGWRIAKAMLLLGAVFLSSVSAEVIHIPVGQQAPELRDLPRPTRGMSEDTVVAEFGEPLSRAAPVGEPPISKWRYPNFTVYFESSVVIHSVLTHKPKHPDMIKQ